MTRTLEDVLAEIGEIPTTWDGTPITVASRNIFGTSPLHMAVIRGDIEAASLLLDGGAEINCIGETGYTPLHEAVEQGHVLLVQWLLVRGAQRDVKNESGDTPLDLAVVIGRDDIASILRAD